MPNNQSSHPNVTSGLAEKNLRTAGGWPAAVRVLALLCLTATGSMTVNGSARAQEDVPTPEPGRMPAALTTLATYITESLPDWNIPGLAVAVVHEGQVVFARGFGLKQVGRNDPVDAHTLFQIGSVTKSFAAAAIGALVDEGLAAWHDPVVDHLPWFRVQDPWITREITLRDLLSHQSGMPGAAYPVLAIVDARETAEGLRLLDNQGPLRQDYRYSNQAYGVAGLVVEAAAGHELERLGTRATAGAPGNAQHRDQSIRRVGLRARRTDLPRQRRPQASPASTTRPAATWPCPTGSTATATGGSCPGSPTTTCRRPAASCPTSSTWRTGSACSSTTAGSTAPPSSIPRPCPKCTRRWFARRPHSSSADPAPGSYGLGWGRANFLGHTYISHGGGIFGFPAYAAMLPELRAGVVVLANGSMWTPYYPHQEVAAWVFGRLLGAEGRDWHGEVMARTEAIHAQVEAALNARAAGRIAGTRPSLSLAGYAGRHEDEFGAATAHVVHDAGSLRVHFGAPGSFSGDMEHWHHDVFQLHYDGGDGQAYGSSFVTFTIGPDGGVTHMDMGFMGRYRRVR